MALFERSPAGRCGAVAAFFRHLCYLGLALTAITGVAAEPSRAGEPSRQSDDSGTGQGGLAELGAKLSNPLSDVWALFTEFDFDWSEGDISDGEHKFGSAMLFQPVLPFKFTDDWKLITRPVVPVAFGVPVPDGINESQGRASFDYKQGLGDIQVPLLFSPNPKPGGHWMFGGGPTFVLPTATSDELGSDKWQAGPALVGVYKTENVTTGALGQYWWSFATQGHNKPDTSNGSILYFYFYNLPNAWQIGTNPTVTYNDKAPSGDKWNVPVGLTVAKTTKIGPLPVKFQFGVQKSVVRQDDFGQDWQIKLNIIPVLPALVKEPLF
jgi:hypothetical protein